MKHILFFLLASLSIISCKNSTSEEKPSEEMTSETTNVSEKEDHQLREISKAKSAPQIDGIANDSVWKNLEWYPLDEKWIGEDYTSEDFSGRYKLTWNEEALYLLVEVKDDSLIDIYKDKFTQWWDDDCVEVFVDEDNSGGEHQFNYNAFAYHVALDGNVVDLGPGEEPHLFNDHVKSAHKTEGKTTVWELKVKLFDDTFKDGEDNKPVTLSEGKKVGFALAYCDNDTSETRENFIGSVYVPGEDKNQGWINADIFGTILLKQ